MNFTINTATDTGHTTNINYNTNYSIMTLMMILFISSWSKTLKTDLFYLS